MLKKIAKPRDSRGNPMAEDCPGREVFNHITSRWAMLIVVVLHDGAQRFHAIRDGIEGISEKMLSQTLKTLARDGFLLRLVEPTVPPQVSYMLTPLGEDLARHFRGLVQWLGNNIDGILAAQRRHDKNVESCVDARPHYSARNRLRP